MRHRRGNAKVHQDRTYSAEGTTEKLRDPQAVRVVNEREGAAYLQREDMDTAYYKICMSPGSDLKRSNPM